MSNPNIVLVGAAPWAEALSQRISAHYTPLIYTEMQGYVARLADDHAAAVLVDGTLSDWRFWVTAVKTSPATRRIPVIVTSDDAATRAQALASGADSATTPSDLLQNYERTIADVARIQRDDALTAMQQQCDQSLPPEAVEAIERFNAGDFYRQHDLFEALWMAESGPVRDLYRAILQVGIAYYQITRGNGRGAHKMLLRSVQWLALLPDACQGVDVAQLKADASSVRTELERVDLNASAFDRTLLKPVRMAQR
jgi:predicted metal-dependent hydrolase